MKKFTLSILALAAVVGIVPASIYPVDVTKDGVTIRVSNEQDRSEILKSNDLLCFYVRIKNDTGAPIELPKYAVSSPLIANEKVLTEAMSSTPKELGKFMARFIVGTGVQLAPCFATAVQMNWILYPTFIQDCIKYLARAGCITSPLTGSAWATTSYLKQARIQSMLQEHLDRKATTIQIGGEVGFYVYIDLDQYRRSIGKNITIKLHKKNSDQVMFYEIVTTGLV